jgi:ferrous iron transport protein B
MRGADLVAVRHVALIGCPNSGKTTLFNILTGLRQKTANYPGVTVEKKEGHLTLPDGSETLLLDLPGTYSLHAHSPDEQVAVDVLLGRTDHTPPPELVVTVVDATNLERNLYLVSQLIDRQLPMLVALTMTDLAQDAGLSVDVGILAAELGVPVIPVIAAKGIGIPELRAAIMATRTAAGRARMWQLPEPVRKEYEELVELLRHHHKLPPPSASSEAVALLTSPAALEEHRDRFSPAVLDHVRKDHQKLDFLGFDRQRVFVESRYAWVRRVCARAVTRKSNGAPSLSDRLDRVFTHGIWGYVLFFGLMGLMFQAIFSWAEFPMRWIEGGFDLTGRGIMAVLPPGELRDLLVNGALAGVAAVVTFLPQIAFLFLFLGVLEDTGYMARAALIMDRMMSRVGLHGRSFIPLLSSFACAIPGIMATRTIESPRDRLVTMLVAPLISCSARLPIYALLIAAFIPDIRLFGFLSLPALVLLSLYLAGLTAALIMALIFKKTLLKGTAPAFIMELPSYRWPSLRSVLLQAWERVRHFLERAGTIILGASIILWFLASYPRMEGASPSVHLQQSFAGRAGRLIEPLVRPLGFDWKIGVGLFGSMLQREVFVSTMGTIFNVEKADGDGAVSLQQHLRSDIDPRTGKPVFSILTGLCLMVYYVLAMQCLSTVAVMRKETNGWKWPLFQVGYMTALAYGATFLVYRAGLWFGLGG